MKDDDPVAAGTVFSYGTDVPPHASFAGGLKENLVLLGQRAFLPVEDLEPTSRYAAEFGQSTSGSTSRAGAADDAPASWRGQPLAPPAEEAHYSLLRSLVRALFLSNGSGAKGMQKGVVPVEALKVLAAKVAQLHGAPLPEGSGFESTSPVNKLNYNGGEPHVRGAAPGRAPGPTGPRGPLRETAGPRKNPRSAPISALAARQPPRQPPAAAPRGSPGGPGRRAARAAGAPGRTPPRPGERAARPRHRSREGSSIHAGRRQRRSHARRAIREK